MAMYFNAYWIEPPIFARTEQDTFYHGNNTVYRVGERLTLEWATLGDRSSVRLNQEYPSMEGSVPAASNITTNEREKQFDWIVDVGDLNLAFSELFFLTLISWYSETGETDAIMSDYFNITRDAITSSSSTMASTNIPSQSPTSAPTSSLIPTASPNSSSSNGELSIGAVAGISIAGTAFLVSCIIGCFWWIVKKKQRGNPFFAGAISPLNSRGQRQNMSEHLSNGQAELPYENVSQLMGDNQAELPAANPRTDS